MKRQKFTSYFSTKETKSPLNWLENFPNINHLHHMEIDNDADDDRKK